MDSRDATEWRRSRLRLRGYEQLRKWTAELKVLPQQKE